MTRKLEFASPEWHDALKSMMERYMKAAGPEVRLTLCEVFTGVPAHLDKSGTGIIAWHCRIADGRLEFHEGEIDDADLKTVADYQFILPFARMKLDPSTMAQYEALQAEGVAQGKLKRTGDRSKVPPAFYGMHNELAEMTA
jgi:hypothetical protein